VTKGLFTKDVFLGGDQKVCSLYEKREDERRKSQVGRGGGGRTSPYKDVFCEHQLRFCIIISRDNRENRNG
jgi:hypothetical protein